MHSYIYCLHLIEIKKICDNNPRTISYSGTITLIFRKWNSQCGIIATYNNWIHIRMIGSNTMNFVSKILVCIIMCEYGSVFLCPPTLWLLNWFGLIKYVCMYRDYGPIFSYMTQFMWTGLLSIYRRGLRVWLEKK